MYKEVTITKQPRLSHSNSSAKCVSLTKSAIITLTWMPQAWLSPQARRRREKMVLTGSSWNFCMSCVASRPWIFTAVASALSKTRYATAPFRAKVKKITVEKFRIYTRTARRRRMRQQLARSRQVRRGQVAKKARGNCAPLTFWLLPGVQQASITNTRPCGLCARSHAWTGHAFTRVRWSSRN